MRNETFLNVMLAIANAAASYVLSQLPPNSFFVYIAEVIIAATGVLLFWRLVWAAAAKFGAKRVGAYLGITTLWLLTVAALTGFGWAILRNVRDPLSPPSLIIQIQAFLPEVDYAVGSSVGGIPWKKGYSHAQLMLTNQTSEIFIDVDVTITPEKPIIAAKIQSEFATCRIGPVGRLPVPIVIGTTSSGEEIGMPAERLDVLIGPPYRLFCDKLPSKAQVLIDLATVEPIYDIMSRDMWVQTRRDPTFIDVHCAFTAYGNRHEDNSRLSFAKPDRR